jgi:ABC-type amino acid transport substrate-binding protein
MPTLIKRSLHVTISKIRSDYKAIADAFNKALAEMKENGRYEEILKKHQYPNL